VSSERINRFLSQRGSLSRRAADEAVLNGRVTVNGRRAILGQSVDPIADRIELDGVLLEVERPPLRTIALNKPAGVVCTRHDPQKRPTVMDLIDDPTLFPVGRLDTPTRGLLLLTNDGDLALRLTHPRHEVRKTYRVQTTEPIEERALNRLLNGVRLEDGPARPKSVMLLADDHMELVMTEGRKREVRRLCEAVGLEVADLLRTAVGPVQLGELAEGSWREITGDELAALQRVGVMVDG
jgi:23S rRNA pseudouridine2605 synthase